MARKECCSVGVDIVEDSEKGTVSLLKRPNSPETVMLHNLCNIHNSASLLIAAACFGKQSSSNNSNVIEIYCYKLSCLAYKILADLSRGPIMVSIMLHDMDLLFVWLTSFVELVQMVHLIPYLQRSSKSCCWSLYSISCTAQLFFETWKLFCFILFWNIFKEFLNFLQNSTS